MPIPSMKQQAALILAVASTPAAVPVQLSVNLEKTVSEASYSLSTSPVDPLVLTEEEIDARAAEVKTAEPSRFRPLSDLLNALRNRRL